MRFTLDLSHHPWTRDPTGEAPAHTLAVARAADAAGIDAIWANEDPEGWDAFAVLSALATVTGRARLGSGVTNPFSRHPNMLAATVATLDRLSGGRAVLGIGRGQLEWHRDALGVDTGAPLTAIAETIALLRAWWQAPHRATSPTDGHFRVREWERVVHPLQAHVPIYLAAAGPKACALAGGLCDGLIFNMLTSEEALREITARVRAAVHAAGRDPDALAFVLRSSLTVVDDVAAERQALDRAKTMFALLATLPGMERLVRSTSYDSEAIVREVAAAMRTREVLAAGGGFPALRRTGDLAAARAAIPDGLIRELALIGSLPALRARLERLAALGITHVGVRPPHDATSENAWRQRLHSLGGGY